MVSTLNITPVNTTAYPKLIGQTTWLKHDSFFLQTRQQCCLHFRFQPANTLNAVLICIDAAAFISSGEKMPLHVIYMYMYMHIQDVICYVLLFVPQSSLHLLRLFVESQLACDGAENVIDKTYATYVEDASFKQKIHIYIYI